MKKFYIVCSYWEYRNDEREITKKSKRHTCSFNGFTIEEAFKKYTEQSFVHNLYKNTSITIIDIYSV